MLLSPPRVHSVRVTVTPTAPAAPAATGSGGEVGVIACRSLDAACAARARHELEQAQAARPLRLVVDLAECRSIDAAGLAVLLEARRRARERGATLVLRGVSQRLRRLLAVSATAGLFELEA